MSKPLRVLQVLGGLDRGGAETMIMNLYRNIDRSKVQFDFAIHYPNKDAYIDEIKKLGGEVYVFPQYTGVNHFIYEQEWKTFFKEHPEIKIIHAHVRSTASIFLNIANRFGIITVSHSHSTSNGRRISSFIKNLFQYPIRYISDYFFAPSNESGKWLFGEKIVKSEKFFILKNAIDAEKFIYDSHLRQDLRKKMGIDSKIVIGHIGSFKKVKNHSFIIEIFRQFLRSNPDSVLLLVGDGELKEGIETLVKKFELEKQVIFLGSRADIDMLLQAMDIIIFPSLYEGIPVSLIEAQASGLPILGSETISKNVAITDLVSFESLSDSSQIWAENLEHKLNIERYNRYEQIASAGYDVKASSLLLQNFYINISSKQEKSY